jgi:phospholipid/cholesterol/gamma-HCH transport system ATP-binding protein
MPIRSDGASPMTDDLAAPGGLGFRRRLSETLIGGGPELSRLSAAQTTVRFEVAGAAHESTTLLLDRHPPAAVDHGEPPDATVTLTQAQAAAFLGGRLPLPSLLVARQVTCRGAIRSYLAVDPILRSRLAAQGHAAPPVPPATGNGREPASGRTPTEDLLAIEMRGVRKAFRDATILDGLDLQVPEGSRTALMGPSGTGKSVLLNHVIGVFEPDAGEVLVRGRAIGGMTEKELQRLRRGIGVMFQDGALLSSMNVYDNVAFPLRQHTDLREDEVREVVMTHLASVGLAEVARRLPSQLSGGMKKRAGLARSLVLDPRIILCDEPDSGLDPVRSALLGELLVDRHATLGGTMLVVTHSVPLARVVADHVIVIWRGKVVAAGPAQAMWTSDDPFIRQFVAGDPHGPLGMDA